MEDLITLHITDLNGVVQNIQAPTDMGLNVMEAIRANELQIKAMCGGMALCATCHVIVLSDHELPSISEAEEAMMDEAFILDIPNSRLSCQIPVTKELDGLALRLGVLTGE